MNSYMTSEEMEIEKQACYEAMREDDNKEEAKQAKVLKRIKKRVSANWFNSIMDFLEDQDYIHDFSIIEKPVGQRQKEDYRFAHSYINIATAEFPAMILQGRLAYLSVVVCTLAFIIVVKNNQIGIK